MQIGKKLVGRLSEVIRVHGHDPTPIREAMSD
jgi:hypothetical protein